MFTTCNVITYGKSVSRYQMFWVHLNISTNIIFDQLSLIIAACLGAPDNYCVCCKSMTYSVEWGVNNANFKLLLLGQT